MNIAKNHLLVTVLLTQASAFIAGQLAYYPTEISRTAASGPIPDLVFKTGLISLIITLLWSGALNQQTSLLWVSLVAIAAFDTMRYPVIHLAGVTGLMMVAVYCAYCNGKDAIFPIGAAVLIFALRIFLKASAVVVYEMDFTVEYVFRREFYTTLFNKAIDISNHGAGACKYSPEHVIPIFKLCGVLQWTVFYALSFLFNEKRNVVV